MLKIRALRITSTFLAAFLLSSCIYYSGPDGGDFRGWRGWNDDTVEGSGRLVSEVRRIGDVNRVRLENQGDLSITIGDADSLVVEAEDNLMPHIRTDVRGGELHIYTEDRRRLRNREPIRYYLTVRRLEGIEIGSTGSVDAPDMVANDFEIRVRSTGNLVMGALEAGDVDINVSSTGDVMLRRLEASRLDVGISSTGHVSIRDGRVRGQDIRISSTGSYEAMDVDSDIADVRLSSTGSAFISVNDYLEATLNSTGSLHYRGEATTNIRRNSVGKAILVSRR